MAKKRAKRSQAAASRVAKLEKRVSNLEAALVRARRVGDALRRVGMAVGAIDHLDELLELVVESTTQVLDAERATLYLLDGDCLISRIKQGDELETIAVPVGKGIAGHVAKTGRTVRVRDAYQDERFDKRWDEKSGYRTKSICAVPIKDHAGAQVGVLQALNKRGPDGKIQPFTRYDSELLSALATQAAVALDNVDLFRRLHSESQELKKTKTRLERTLRDLELLYELETSMGRAESVQQIAKHAVTLTARACDARAGALLHQAGGTLTLYVINMKHPDEVRPVIVRHGEGIAARAMECGKLLRIDDPKKVDDPRRVRGHLGLTLRSAIAAPLRHSENATGAIALYNNTGRPSRFSEDDGALLKLVSANVSTEIRAFEARSQRERGERLSSIGGLLSGVMHDLRTPLTVISGYVQLMAVTDDAEQREQHAETISEQFELIGAMQRDLLAYARGETSLLIRKVYIAKFCQDIARQFRPELDSRGIVLQMDVRETGIAFFDEQRMARAMGNLVRNAIEAMESKGGTLTVGADGEDDDLVLWVSDTGKGIPKAIRKKIFEPFVTAGKKLGTGLGLSNVKKIVDEHGGTIDVTSSRKGTRFEIRLAGATRPHSLRPPVSRRSPSEASEGEAPGAVKVAKA